MRQADRIAHHLGHYLLHIQALEKKEMCATMMVLKSSARNATGVDLESAARTRVRR